MAINGPTAKSGGSRALTITTRAEIGEIPTPPQGLLKAQREVWDQFWTSDVALAIDPASDLPVVSRWIGTVDELHRTQTEVRRMKDKTTLGSSGQLRLHLLIGYADKLTAQLGKLERTLGIGPLNRAALGLTIGQAMTVADMNRLVADAPTDPDPDMIEIMQEFSE